MSAATSLARFWENLAAMVAKQRECQGITQAQLGARAGVHRVTVCNLERGKVRDLGIAKVHSILSCLDIQLSIAPVTKKPRK
ncbi:MAG: XRE family transcriptional regulator [Burkholderiales bacterium]|nr:XRE family transcriptional regulator [Burkholderiales bacterium]